MRIHNTLSGTKEEFQPSDDVVKMYVCGVTPYDETHLGHAMSYLVFDVIRRYLEYKGYKVKHVQNFTDIDDKLIMRANRLGTSVRELAQRYIDQYFEVTDALNIQRAHVYPRATEEVPTIIEIIQELVKRGHAYHSGDDVYFRISTASDYGKFSHQNLEELQQGVRIEVGEGKEHPMDFTLWKGANPGEPQWESPWGPGRPGWHIECTAMATRYLGETIDIHGGGQDLIFPHHENEIAQSESYTGMKPFVKYWMHNGLLQMGEEKMSKSLGNLVTVKEALSKYSPDAIRLFVISSHYRSPLTYVEEGLAAAERGIERLRGALREERQGTEPGLDGELFKKHFIEVMDDDFNTAQAVAVLFDLVRDINRAREAGGSIMAAQATLRELAHTLGFTLAEPNAGQRAAVEPFIDLLVATRAELRIAKQWSLADRIRERLGELGVLLEDSPQGTTWRFG